MKMKFLILTILFSTLYASLSGQNNTGTPYSMYGVGLMKDNYGPYVGMGGVSVAMRDNKNINYQNPASYTALDSNRFYLQLGMVGEYVHISTYSESSNYRVAQNAALNMALRIAPKVFMSLGFTQRSDVGYDLYYYREISGTGNQYYTQQISGDGGLNDCYIGLGYKLGKRLSIGLNTSYVFGNLSRKQYLIPYLSNSYYIYTLSTTHTRGVIFNGGFQYIQPLKDKSSLTIGATAEIATKFSTKKSYEPYEILSSTSGSTSSLIVEEYDIHSTIKYPVRYSIGLNYQWKNRWEVAGDYSYQKMSKYEEFGETLNFNDYHKIALGTSCVPNKNGRFWWQRNKYQFGTYWARTQIEIEGVKVNTYGLTLGTQFPVHIPDRELMLGVALDLGLRGSEKNGMIQERYAKLRLNIAFQESWFTKRKID